MPRRYQLERKKFGRLFVIGISDEKDSQNIRKWLCRCDCGKYTYATSNVLYKGHVRSCGCLQEEYQAKRKKCFDIDDKRLYHIWRGMNERCYDSNSKNLKRYGKRGIVVCDEWKHNFEAFKLWAKANGYGNKLTLDRVNNNGNYEPSNCRWADLITQMNNRRTNVKITINGETHTIAEWGRIKGISEQTIWCRLYSLGWSEYDAVMKPIRGKRKNE